MRKGEVRHIGTIVDKFLSGCSITPDGYALRVFFSEFIGPKLSKYAELVKFSKDTVFISVKSAVVKNEITLMRRKIIKALNEFFGSDKIKNLKIVEE
ncbi:MAG: DUF721 domain-containing protein [Elusimicrobiota bacterium]